MEDVSQFFVSSARTYGADIAFILGLFLIGKFALKKVVDKVVVLTRSGDGRRKAAEKRVETLGHVVVRTGSIVIYAVVLLMALRLFGIDVTPILAGAGIIGLAVGFGSQTLVKDFMSSLFILIENQYGVGDKVRISGLEGTVIKITMRSTVLRDEEGGKYYLPNGSITNVINFSQKD